jgi:hypothetical protein
MLYMYGVSSAIQGLEQLLISTTRVRNVGHKQKLSHKVEKSHFPSSSMLYLH